MRVMSVSDRCSTPPDPTFFPGHAAAIHLRIEGKEHVIGSFGILHPTVLEKFELRYGRPKSLVLHRTTECV